MAHEHDPLVSALRLIDRVRAVAHVLNDAIGDARGGPVYLPSFLSVQALHVSELARPLEELLDANRCPWPPNIRAALEVAADSIRGLGIYWAFAVRHLNDCRRPPSNWHEIRLALDRSYRTLANAYHHLVGCIEGSNLQN